MGSWDNVCGYWKAVPLWQGRAKVACLAHNQKVGSSILPPATIVFAATELAKMRKPRSGSNNLPSEGQTERSPRCYDGNQQRHQRQRNCLGNQEGGSLSSTTSFKRVCLFSLSKNRLTYAGVAEQVYAADLKSAAREGLGVRLPFAPP